MEVEVLVPAAERRGVARMVEQPRDLAAQVLPVGAPDKHSLSQLRLLRHELLRLLRVRVLQPAQCAAQGLTTSERNLTLQRTCAVAYQR